MAEANSGQERTEEATPRRIEKAREEGQVVRSRELTAMGVLLGSAASLLFLGPVMIAGVADLMRKYFSIDRDELVSGSRAFAPFADAIIESLKLLAPFFVLVFIIALLMPTAVGGWSFAVKALSFKWSKLDPVKGMQRVFGVRGLVELLKALAKFTLVAGVAVTVLWMEVNAFIELGSMSIQDALAGSMRLMGWTFVVLCASLVLVALVDVPFQLWEHRRQLKMTRQELKDEYKETDGKPEVKARIRSLQRELAFRRMMDEVPKADVIVTNPSHYSVALRYDQARMNAPVLLAKGVDETAMRIRELGRSHRVPIVPMPLVSRAIYYNTRIGQEIPAGLYVAVAQILAYVFQLKRYRGGGQARPRLPDRLEVPEELLQKIPADAGSPATERG